MEKLLEIFQCLGLPVVPGNLEGPSTCLVFLGFERDTKEMVVRLPDQKLREVRDLVSHWRGKRVCTLKELESLIGKLGYAAQVVTPGKTFMRRMFELKAKVRRDQRWCRLNAGFRSDILWWATFLEAWNGVSAMKGRAQE